ncbi:MAG: type V CRISPR-associated endonuclease Cas1 [Bacteroidota bacterium]|nr:type V CRISPR-associated endonuclease Cas1 [Bacteroidota bacterium]
MLSLPDYKQKSIVVCFASEGQKIAFKNDNLIIKDAEENILLQATCHKIFSVWVVGHASITSGILQRSRKFAFSIYLLSYTHKPYGLWNSATEGNFLLRRKQYEYRGLDIARHIVRNKIENQAALLKSLRAKSPVMKAAIKKMEEYHLQTATALDLQTLLGMEGVSSRLFFSHWFGTMGWTARRPRVKHDYLNTTMDIGYTYLFNIVECMLNLYGFDVYQGIYHRCFYQRKSLVCDLVEPFRSIIDRQIRKAHGLGQLKKEDFDEHRGQYFLKPDKNKEYTRWMIASILVYKETIFSFVQEYYRAFIRGKPIEAYPVFKIDD